MIQSKELDISLNIVKIFEKVIENQKKSGFKIKEGEECISCDKMIDLSLKFNVMDVLHLLKHCGLDIEKYYRNGKDEGITTPMLAAQYNNLRHQIFL